MCLPLTLLRAAVISHANIIWGRNDKGRYRARQLVSLRECATERLACYKLPTLLEIVDALPRNPAAKVLKVELRDRFQR